MTSRSDDGRHRSPGRPRDTSIDASVLRVAAAHLARVGYDGLSVSAVATEAGTTRQALYRRYPTKADLATAAIESVADSTSATPTGEAFTDLVAELESFRRGVSRPDGVSMVGTMLTSSVDPELRAQYRARIVAPRRARLRRILAGAVEAGLLEPDADLDLAVASCTGSFYALQLAGAPVPRDWPRRMAALVWAGCGGRPPR